MGSPEERLSPAVLRQHHDDGAWHQSPVRFFSVYGGRECVLARASRCWRAGRKGGPVRKAFPAVRGRFYMKSLLVLLRALGMQLAVRLFPQKRTAYLSSTSLAVSFAMEL